MSWLKKRAAQPCDHKPSNAGRELSGVRTDAGWAVFDFEAWCSICQCRYKGTEVVYTPVAASWIAARVDAECQEKERP
jgi:hypothetical protein